MQGSYHLLARRDDKTKLLAAPAGPVTHDPGAGRGPTGKPTAVYQRCSGKRCSIWSIDLATGAQRRVGGLGKIERAVSRASQETLIEHETHPRIWGSNVAFHTFAGKGSRLRVGPSAAGRGAVRTIPIQPGEDKSELSELALGPKHVVALWQDQLCFGNCVGLYITGIASGREQVIDDGGRTSTCLGHLDDLRFDGSAFRWTRELFPASRATTARRRSPAGATPPARDARPSSERWCDPRSCWRCCLGARGRAPATRVRQWLRARRR